MTCRVILDETAEPCGEPDAGRGLCEFHRRRVYKGWPPERLGAARGERRTVPSVEQCRVILHETDIRCDEPVKTRGLCTVHYPRWINGWPEDRLGAPPFARKEPFEAQTCSVVEHESGERCSRPPAAHGRCAVHGARARNGWTEDELGLPIGTHRPRRRAVCPIILHETQQRCERLVVRQGHCQLHSRRIQAGWPPERLGEPAGARPRCGSRTPTGPCSTLVERYGLRCADHSTSIAASAGRPAAFARRSFEPVEDPDACRDDALRLIEQYRGSADSAYRNNRLWIAFEGWAHRRGLPSTVPVPFHVMALYLTTLTDPAVLDPERGRDAPFKMSSISKVRSAFRTRHLEADLPSPTDDPHMVPLWKGIRQGRGTTSTTPALLVADMVQLLEAGGTDGPLWHRDRALFLTSWHRALEPADWKPLRWDTDVVRSDAGYTVCIAARNVGDGVPPLQLPLRPAFNPVLCPVAALDEWRRIQNPPPHGLVFASTGASNAVPLGTAPASRRLKDAAGRAGLRNPEAYSLSSLTEGFYATAIDTGATEVALHNATGISLRSARKRIDDRNAHATASENARALRGEP